MQNPTPKPVQPSGLGCGPPVLHPGLLWLEGVKPKHGNPRHRPPDVHSRPGLPGIHSKTALALFLPLAGACTYLQTQLS